MYLLNRAFSVFVLLLVALLLDAFQATRLRGASPVKINEVTFTAFNYSFTGPDSMPAGLTTIRIINKGQDWHQVSLIKLAEGKTVEDFREAMKTNPSDILPGWAGYVGGPNVFIPGGGGTAMVKLEKGNYLVTCFMPDSKGVPHVALGMLKPLTVTAASGLPSAEPKNDLSIEIMDFAIKVSNPITAGTHTIRIHNKGTMPHELQVVQLEPGASAKDFTAALEPGAPGPPPGKAIGGLSAIEKGKHGFFTTQFEPGNYALICFMPDPESRKPHFALGMTHEFTVK